MTAQGRLPPLTPKTRASADSSQADLGGGAENFYFGWQDQTGQRTLSFSEPLAGLDPNLPLGYSA